MSEWIDYKSLRAKLDFRQVLKHYNVEVKVKGERATAFCPLPTHQGERHSPSFSVNLARGLFQCFGCKAGGNCLDFAVRMEGFNPANAAEFREGALKVREKFNLGPETSASKIARPKRDPSNREPKKEIAQASGDGGGKEKQVVVNAPLDFALKELDSAHPYLHERGFTDETIQHFGLGYCNRGMLRSRVAIPLHDEKAQLVGYAGRLTNDREVSETNPKYRFPGEREHQGVLHRFEKSRLLYNYHRITKPAKELIVVEGFASVWWLTQCGFPHCVALMGSSVGVRQDELIFDLLHPDGRLWIFTDGDKAGEQCAQELFFYLASRRWVRWVKLEEGQPTDCSAQALQQIFSE